MVKLDPKLDLETARSLITMEAEDAREIVEEAALDLAERRIRRQRRGRSGKQHRCQACNKFMVGTTGPCGSCGYWQDAGYLAA